MTPQARQTVVLPEKSSIILYSVEQGREQSCRAVRADLNTDVPEKTDRDRRMRSSTAGWDFLLRRKPDEYRFSALAGPGIHCLQFPEPVTECRLGDPILQAPVPAGQAAFLESQDPFRPEVRFCSCVTIHTKHLHIFETSISNIWRDSQIRIITYLRGIKKRLDFFDGNAIDAARFIFGADVGEVVWHEGRMTIDEEVEPDYEEPRNEETGSSSGPILEGSRNNTMSRFAGRGVNGMMPHKATDILTKITNCAPGEEGKQLWEDALQLFFCGDQELIEYVQMTVGMAVVGKVYVEAFIIAYGEGRNGKSTFWNTISRVLGTYSGAMSADSLTANCRRNVKPEIAELKGKRLIIAAELEEGTRLSTSILKQLCSTDQIRGEKKFKDPFDFTPSHTAVLYTNHLPKVSASDDGTWRRLIVIPFHAKIEGSSDIKNYADYLYNDAGPAVMSWIIEGARKVIERFYSQLTSVDGEYLIKRLQDEMRQSDAKRAAGTSGGRFRRRQSEGEKINPIGGSL